MHRVQCVHVVYSVPIRFEDRLARIQLEIIYVLSTCIGKLSTCLQLHDCLAIVCAKWCMGGKERMCMQSEEEKGGWATCRCHTCNVAISQHLPCIIMCKRHFQLKVHDLCG